jgi:hypothetical protein
MIWNKIKTQQCVAAFKAVKMSKCCLVCGRNKKSHFLWEKNVDKCEISKKVKKDERTHLVECKNKGHFGKKNPVNFVKDHVGNASNFISNIISIAFDQSWIFQFLVNSNSYRSMTICRISFYQDLIWNFVV